MRPVRWLELETSSLCNRVCPACIRNSHPNREAVSPWFKQNLMPMDMIKEILDQAAVLSAPGRICLAHFNEPLMDDRIVDIVRLVKSHDLWFTYVITNGDFLSKILARELDGLLDRIVISLYEKNLLDRGIEKRYFRSLFNRTQVIFKGEHTITHYAGEAKNLAECLKEGTCRGYLRRLTLNHRGQYLLCCEDITGSFDLGTFPEISLQKYWYGESRSKVLSDLRTPGGRKKYEYCLNCPR